jgi:hypothetical protein
MSAPLMGLLGSSSELSGVGCTTQSLCMAVGWWTIEPENSLAMLWNGSTWMMKTVPDSSDTDDNFLNSISCVTTSFCIAVGDADGQVIDKWNGTTWSIVSTGTNGARNGVRCRSTSFCIAVDAQGNSTVQTLVERWNGSTRSTMPSPNISGSPANFLETVSCTGTTFCMAGGNYIGSGSTQLTLTEDWTGGAWAVVPSPNPSSTTDAISSVSCTKATSGGNFCLAVGSEAGLTLVEKFS